MDTDIVVPYAPWNTMELLKIKKSLFEDTWMELENNILNEVNQYQDGMHGMYSLISRY